MKKLLLCIFVIAGFMNRISAQTDTCVQHLKEASANYDNGFYDQSIYQLKGILKNCPLDRDDRIEALKLLIICEIKIDNLEDADKAAEKILSINPTYRPDKVKDDESLISEFNKFKPTPVYSLGISGGMNFSQIQVEKTYSVTHNDDSPNLGKYQSDDGFQLYIYGQRRVINKLWIEIGFGYSTLKYKHNLDSIEGSTTQYSEELSYFNVPIDLKYYFLNKEVTPFIYAGTNFSFLNSALSTTSLNGQQDLVDRSALRNSFMLNVLGGAGVNYHFKAFNFFFQADYSYYPQNLNKAGTRYDDPINLFKYYYIDDDFKLHHFNISIGGSYDLVYRNKKIKR